MQQRMRDNWSATRILCQNDTPDQPWPPRDEASTQDPRPLAPWVFFEVLGSSSGIRGVGMPGSHVWLYRGLILAHVFTETGKGSTIGQQYAVTIGEIFRAKEFYNSDPGACVRTWSPQTDGGDFSDFHGNWFRVTCSIPFEFYYRG